MSLFSRSDKDKADSASQNADGIPPALRKALAGLLPAGGGTAATPASVSRFPDTDLEAWLARGDNLVSLELFAGAVDSPSAVLLLSVNMASAAGSDQLISAFHREVGPLLCRPSATASGGPALAPWYLPRFLPAGGAVLLRQELADWQALGVGGPKPGLVLLVPESGLRLAAMAPAIQAAAAGPVAPGNAVPMQVIVREPGEFHYARLFLPLTLRRADMTIRCRVRSLRWCPPGSLASASDAASPPADTLYALRWTIGGEHLVFWLRCPAAVPPTMVRTLLLEGAATFGRMAGPLAAAPELAGPVTAKALDPRLGLAEFTYEVTVRRQTTTWQVLVPTALTERLHKLFCDPVELDLMSGAAKAAGATAAPGGKAGLPTLMSVIALNRRLLERGLVLSQATPEAVGEEDIACALYDRVDSLPEHDLTIIVQNHLIPRGTDAVMDCFFPRGGFDPLVWTRVSRTLGEKLTLPLAEALKSGKNKASGLTAATLGELVQAVTGKRLELSPRGKRLVGTILGGMLDGTARKQLEPINAAGLPGVLLARLPIDQRMKALTDMVDRERLIAFLGQRDHVLTLMEGFSKNGKQRSLEDYDVLVKAWERGDVATPLIIASKNEACCFIARHLALQVMGVWPNSEWKKFQESLGAEDLLFFLQESEASCFWETPLRTKLLAGITKDFIQGLEAQLASQKKEAGWQPKLPAFIHRDLAERLLALVEVEGGDELVGGGKPGAKPGPKPGPKPKK